jgi:hypothetical protein
MARRNRRRSRPRHHLHRRVPDRTDSPFSSTSSIDINLVRSKRYHCGRHWQALAETLAADKLQARHQIQLEPVVEFRGQAEPSPESDSAILRQRLQVFGGTERDGTTLCGPMLRVVMSLFDGGLDYMDP